MTGQFGRLQVSAGHEQVEQLQYSLPGLMCVCVWCWANLSDLRSDLACRPSVERGVGARGIGAPSLSHPFWSFMPMTLLQV